MSENIEVSWVAVIDTAKKIAEIKIEPVEKKTRDTADILASWDGVFNV
jgi:hypothetical protein